MKNAERDSPRPRPLPSYARETYFESAPTIPSRTQDVSLKLPHLDVMLKTDRGTFSYEHVDPGTKVLLRVAPPTTPTGDLLDLGCGYGPITMALALRYPERLIWGVDVNERALDLARDNAARLGLVNVRIALPETAKAGVFAAIYSNPPVRVGKDRMRALLLEWLARLAPAGRAYWVVKKNLGADSLAEYLTGEGYATTRLGSKQGYRVLESRPAHR